MFQRPGQSLHLLLGDWMPLTCESHIPALLLQFPPVPTLFTFLGMQRVRTINRITNRSLGLYCNCPVIGRDLVDAHVLPGWEDRYWCTVSQHRDLLSLEKCQRLYALVTHSSTPLCGTLLQLVAPEFLLPKLLSVWNDTKLVGCQLEQTMITVKDRLIIHRVKVT